MRNRILGVIGMVLGAPATLGKLNGLGPTNPDPAARMGWYVGSWFGVLLFLTGAFYLVRGDGFPTRKKKKKKPKYAIRTPGAPARTPPRELD